MPRRRGKGRERSGISAGRAGAALTLLGLMVWTAVSALPADDAAQLCPAGDRALAMNPQRLGAGSSAPQPRLFRAGYSKADWTGSLRALDLNTDGTPKASAVWDAAGAMPATDARRILASSGSAGVEFKWASLGADLQSRLGSEAVLNYLRGDQGGEVSRGGGFRSRSARLGAIVNSDIVYAGSEDFGYAALPGVAGQTYPAYVQTKGPANRSQLVVVGANDGMLHGFDVATGIEKFAYVPHGLLRESISAGDPRSALTRLADPAFVPRYYVDGSPWVGDAYWGGAWRTVVVGTAGAGGKGVFALDISAPEDMAPSRVLWDLWDGDGRSGADLGYAFGPPVIGRLADGNFYAFFGNGRESASGCAVLYVVRLDSGQVRRISTGACGGNGLGRPSLYDLHRAGESGFRVTDFVYAGDLKGNVWRFDLRNANLTSDPPTGAAVQLIFTARNGSGEAQPITGTIEIGAAPSGVAGDTRPAMLWFGTGVLTDAARSDDGVQSMYGVVDRFAAGASASAKVSRGALQPQAAHVSGGLAGTITGAAVNYSGGQDGWYVDLPRAGERMVGLPLIQFGRLFFSTQASGGSCLGGGTSIVYAVDPYRGNALSQRAFARHPGADFIDSGVGVVRDLVISDTGVRSFLYAGGSSPPTGGSGTTQVDEIVASPQAGPRGRVSWREVFR